MALPKPAGTPSKKSNVIQAPEMPEIGGQKKRMTGFKSGKSSINQVVPVHSRRSK